MQALCYTALRWQAHTGRTEEREDIQFLDLARIAFFNRRDYGRLRQMIEVLNNF